MNGQDHNRLHAFVFNAVRRDIAAADARAGSWDSNRVLRAVSTGASVLAALLGALLAPAGSRPPDAVGGLRDGAQKALETVKQETAPHPSTNRNLDSWPDDTAWEQWALSQALLDRLATLDLSVVPYQSLQQNVTVLASLPPLPDLESMPPEQIAVADVLPVVSLVFDGFSARVSGAVSASLAAFDNEQVGYKSSCCCCQQPSQTQVAPLPQPPPPPADATKAGDHAETAAKNAEKSAQAAAKILRAIQDTAAAAAVTVTFRVPVNAYSECRAIPDFRTAADRPLVVQFEAEQRGKSVSIAAHNCNPKDTENTFDSKDFPGRGTQPFEIKTGDDSRQLMVSLISFETTRRFAGLGRKNTAVVVTSWVVHKPK
jgi:hypothetical protein